MKMRIPLLLTLPLALVACSSGGLEHRVDDSKLAGISPKAQAEIAGAEQSLKSAQERHASASQLYEASKVELVRAESDLEVTKKRIDTLEDLKEAAEKAKDETRASETEQTITALEALKEAQEQDVELQESRVQYTEKNAESAMAQVEVAEAQLEEIRAQAVYEVTQDSNDRVKMADYKIQASKKLEKASDRELQSAKAFKSMEENRAEYEEVLAKVPAAIGTAEKALASANKQNDELTRQLDQLKGQLGSLEAHNTKLQKTISAGRMMLEGTEATPASTKKEMVEGSATESDGGSSQPAESDAQ